MSMEQFRLWADRKHRRQCACEWEDSEKCARGKRLVGTICKCVCHQTNIPVELDQIADVVLAYKPKPKSKAAKKRVRKAKKDAREA
jgi:hypothetical protein